MTNQTAKTFIDEMSHNELLEAFGVILERLLPDEIAEVMFMELITDDIIRVLQELKKKI